MKDLEKIKSEDLACQVADANPANFAIEQEVAQLVGATVPQPTEPSADDARELGAQLLVFLRRALLPIRSALRTAVAAIYDHLDSRCTDYTPAAYASYIPRPYDPMGLTPRTLPNLLTALTAFAPRKISNGGNTPDGISLAHIIFNNEFRNSLTELIDDNEEWNMNHVGYSNYGNYLTEFFPNLKKIRIGAKEIHCIYLSTGSSVEEFELPNAEYISLGVSGVHGQHIISNAKVTELTFPAMTKFTGIYGSSWYWFASLPNCKKVSFPVLNNITFDGNRGGYSIHYFGNCPVLEEVHFPSLTNRLQSSNMTESGSSTDQNMAAGCPKLRLFEIGQGYSQNLYLAGWNPDSETLAHQDFLPNFKENIALRLTANGSGLTLTLSQAVFSAVIEGSSPICDDIKGIIEDKGWKVQDTNNNIFPTT